MDTGHLDKERERGRKKGMRWEGTRRQGPQTSLFKLLRREILLFSTVYHRLACARARVTRTCAKRSPLALSVVLTRRIASSRFASGEKVTRSTRRTARIRRTTWRADPPRVLLESSSSQTIRLYHILRICLLVPYTHLHIAVDKCARQRNSKSGLSLLS